MYHTYVHTNIWIDIIKCISIHNHTYIYTRIHECIHIQLCTYISIFKYKHAYIRAYIHISLHMFMRILIHIRKIFSSKTIILNSNSNNLKQYNSEPIPVQAECCLYSVCSNCTNICLDLCDQNWSGPDGAGEVYRIERGAVLYCTARGTSVCFTYHSTLSGPRSFLDLLGKKISASHQFTKPYIVRTALHIWSLSAGKDIISRKADG